MSFAIALASLGGSLQQGSIRGIFSSLGNSEIGLFLVPFLLIFGIIYGVLSKQDIMGDKAAAIVAVAISLIISFQVRSLGLVSRLLMSISSPLMIILVGLIVVWLIYGLVKTPAKEGGSDWVAPVIFLILVLGVLFFMMPGMLGGISGGIPFTGNWLAIAILILVVIIIIWVVTGGSGDSSHS